MQFGTNGLVSQTQATYIGIDVSKKLTKQLNAALESLFGTTGASSPLDPSLIPTTVGAGLVMLKSGTIKNCFTITAKPKA